MAGIDDPTDRPIDLRHDNENDAGAQVDAVTDVTAASVAFNNASLPPDMPDWKAGAIRAEAAEIVQAIQSDELRIAVVKQDEEDAQENIANMAQALAAQREREWDQSQISIGHVTMSGQEWDDAYELLSDPASRDRLVQKAMQNRGWSQTRAEKAADDALTLAQIAQKKKDGSITAADEAKADEITSRNPDAAVMAKEAARANQGRDMNAGIDRSTYAQSSLSGDTTVAAKSRVTAVQETANDMETSKTFASAPPLASAFDTARKDSAISQPNDASVKPLPTRLVAQIDMNGPF